MDYQDPALAIGDASPSITDYVLDSAGSELGFYAMAILACILILLNQVNGKPFRLKIFLMNRDFALTQNEGLIKFVNFNLGVITWLSYLLPFLSLAVWAAGLIIRANDFNTTPIGGIAVILVGLSFILFVYGFFRIKWNNFQMGLVSGFSFLLAFALLTAYQYMVIELDNSSRSFFGYSAVFLNANLIILTLALFLNSGQIGGSIADVIVNKLAKGEPLDEKRETDFQEEVKEQRENKQFTPTQNDIIDLFTVGTVGGDELLKGSAFGGGLQAKFRMLHHRTKVLITFFLWCCATAVLIIYSYVIYWVFDYSRLGFVNMIATLITDVFIYFLWNAKITNSVTMLVVAGFLNRLLLFCFGGNFWLYGYILLYLIYGVVLSFKIAEKRFPFESALSEIDLDDISKRRTASDVSRTPEFVLMLITVFYIILFVALYVTEPVGVPLTRMPIDGFDYPYYIIGTFVLLLVATFFSLVSTYRLFQRKKKNIQPQMKFYFKHMRFDLYWMYIAISFILLAAVGLISSWITDVISTFIIIIFVSIFVILYLNVILHYMMNDYNIFMDIKALNAKIRKHNQRIVDLKTKVGNIKKDLKDGNASIIGAGNADLAKSIMDKDKQKKLEQKKQTQIKQDAMSASQSPNVLSKSTSAKVQGLSNTINKVNPFTEAEVKIVVQQPPQQTAISKVSPLPSITKVPNSGGRGNEDDDKLIQEEMSKAGRDEMYEGGEEEKQQSPTPNGANTPYASNQPGDDAADNNDQESESEDSSDDEEVDLDDEDEETDQKKQRKAIRELADWRDEMTSISAFFKGRLRPTDYQIIISLIIAHCAIILMAILVSYADDLDTGVQIAVPIVHYFTVAFVLLKTLSTDAKMTKEQYFGYIFAYALQYGWGIGSLYINYQAIDFDPSQPQPSPAATYLLVYLIVIPFITSALSAFAKIYDDKGQISGFALFMIIFGAFQIIAMLVLAFIYASDGQGIAIVVSTVAIGYVIFQIYVYVKNGYYMPKLWTAINIVIVSLIVIACTVVSLFFEQFRTYTGVSISTWVLAFCLALIGFSELLTDLRMMGTKPTFFSPSIFPIYIYNPKKNDVESKNQPTILVFTAIIIIILWSVTCTVWVYPHNIGISIGIFFEQLLIIVAFHLIGVSSAQLHHVTKEVDKKILRRAFLDAKSAYVNGRQAINRDQLLTYEKITYRRDHFRNYMRVKENRDYLNLEERSEGIKFIPNQEVDIEWVDENLVDLNSQISCYSYLFVLEKEQNRIYREELEFIIQLQLLIVVNAESFEEQKKKYLFTFLQERKAALFALGIVINIPETGTTTVRYARVITQIQKLTPEKQTIFNKLREQFIQDQRDLDDKRREQALIEEQKQKERQEMLSQLSEEKKKLLESVSMDMAVDDMPDCEMKFDKIKLEATNDGKIFVDNKFKANGDSLGQNCQNRGVSQWLRARDKPNTFLYKDKVSCLDVTQGALGDCYFLSAISVLGERYVRRVIVSSEDDWKLTGAFLVKFFKNGEPEFVIVDDFFPAYPNGDWAFVKGGQGDELWPQVLEKAYAKLYGSYNYIEAGKVQYALSDMTDGFPEQIDLKVEGKNIQKLWETLKGLKRHAALMGAGSPENTLGDKAINEMGIVQGHAYAILDVQEIDGNQLMQLRNPHGSTGVEWNGDWSDGSEKWNARVKNKLGYSESADGAFWMSALDFVQQYSYLYICRILEEDDGWVEIPIVDAWKGGSAEGLPSRANPNPRLDFNPQYVITITKPCEGFICLRQFDNENMFKGKHNIFFMVSKVNGKRITKVDKATMHMRSGNPTNLNVITAECDFDKSVSYPYKFTLMVANLEHGQPGEGGFEIAVYSTDKNMKFEPLPFPSDFKKATNAQPGNQ